MYCSQCGGTNDDSLRYCRTCGLDLEEYRRQWQEGQGQGQGQGQDQTPPQQTPPGGQYRQGYAQGPQQDYQRAQPPYPYQTQPYSNQYYQQPQYGYGYGNVERIPSYMAWAIITLILCFWPTGIAAVVYASRVGDRLAIGDIAGAREASRKAKMWSWISFGIALAGVVIAIIFSILVAAVSFNSIY